MLMAAGRDVEATAYVLGAECQVNRTLEEAVDLEERRFDPASLAELE